MMDKMKSSWRYLRREYPMASLMGGICMALGAVGIGIAIPASGLVIALGALAGGVVVGALGAGFSLVGGESGRPQGNTAQVGDWTVTGAVRDVATIAMTQRLINDCTERLQHLKTLPRKTAARIDAHILDAQGAMSRCRFFSTSGEGFRFTRAVLNGTKTERAELSDAAPAQKVTAFGELVAASLPPSGALAKRFEAGIDNQVNAPAAPNVPKAPEAPHM